MFISFEGIDGAGKSTQIRLLKEYFENKNRSVVVTREPGGTKTGELIRNIFKNSDLDIKSEILLLYASRLEHVEKIIKPNIDSGKIVISDRFNDSTIAYQHYGRGLRIEDIDIIKEFSIGNFEPNITFFIDIDVNLKNRRTSSRTLDRIEKESREFFQRVSEGYSEIAKKNISRIVTLDGSLKINKIHYEIIQHIENMINDVKI
jgi:dTMP kinase